MSLTLAQNRPHKWWAFAAIALGTFTSVVDHGAVFVALPTIATRFHTDLPTVQWVTLGYAAAISAAPLPMGRLSDIIGRKQVYLSGFTIAIVSTAIAGFSTSILVLILAKVLHGIGVGMSQGTGMAMIASLFPENERGKALGTHLSVVGVGVKAGPALGGLLVSSLGWRWVFFFNIPAGVLAIATALVLLRGSSFAQGGPRPRFDWLGAAVSTAMLATFLLALANGPRIGWNSPVIIGLGLCSVILLAAFIWWEMHTVSPMLDLRLFKRWLFSLGISAGFIAFLTTSSIPVMMPFYLQAVLEIRTETPILPKPSFS